MSAGVTTMVLVHCDTLNNRILFLRGKKHFESPARRREFSYLPFSFSSGFYCFLFCCLKALS